MKIIENATVKQLESSGGEVSAQIDVEGKLAWLKFDTVISAAGIVGNVENLGLEVLGVDIDRGHVVTDEYCRTSVENIYAIGDVAGAPWLAHKASYEGSMVAELLAGKNVQPESIAKCTYCHPQVASVGYSQTRAKALGFEIKVGSFPFLGMVKQLRWVIPKI